MNRGFRKSAAETLRSADRGRLDSTTRRCAPRSRASGWPRLCVFVCELLAIGGLGCGGAIGTTEGGDSGASDSGSSSSDAATAAPDAGAPDASATTCGPADAPYPCDSPLVPGGTYSRSYDAVTYTDPSYVATVDDFRFDRYDVTVARFRRFVAAYPGSTPAAGAGKDPNDPSDSGWLAAWDAILPATSADLMTDLKTDTDGNVGSWTDTPGANEDMPITTLTFYEAFAFCVWDGGRLPTEAEWNYAAAGGSEQRVYPWSVPASSTTVDATYAVYDVGAVAPVGSKSPKGDGKWGQADLGGNVWQYTVDYDNEPYAINPCDDCAELEVAPSRITRGGSANHDETQMAASLRHAFEAPTVRWYDVGMRCVRAP